jgi:hypothetical protein
MSTKRLSAQPIREGVLVSSDRSKTVWREYLWNNGRVSRMWFVDPGEVDELAVETRPLTSNDCSIGTD